MRRLLGWLLHLANGHPPTNHTAAFYRLKERLLKGRQNGHDVQHLGARCWGELRGVRCVGSLCMRCAGTGDYWEKWVILERFELGGYTFHRPGLVRRTPPYAVALPEGVNLIEGYIRHDDVDWNSSREAALWLALVFDLRLFWRLIFSGGCASHPRWGLSLVQKACWRLTDPLVRLRDRWEDFRYQHDPFYRRRRDEEIPF
jgi:hypothetical protein